MSAYRRNRSKFDALPDVERVHVRERAQTIAEQRFRDMPGQGEPPRHKPGNTGGTYNSDTPGDTRGSTMANTGGGVELLARVINNRVKGCGRAVRQDEDADEPAVASAATAASGGVSGRAGEGCRTDHADSARDPASPGAAGRAAGAGGWPCDAGDASDRVTHEGQAEAPAGAHRRAV
jgi:hypothetical protein